MIVASQKVGIQEREVYRKPFVEQFMTNQEKFFEEMIAPIESRMMRTIWRVVRNEQLAEDTFQDALTLVWKKRERIEGHPNPEALILKMCLSCGYDALRKQVRYLRRKDSRIMARQRHSSDASAHRELEGREVEAEVLSAIGHLPRKQALAVLMRIVQGQPYDAIAQALGCSETTVRIHVSRGRKRLSERLSHLLQSPPRKEPDRKRNTHE